MITAQTRKRWLLCSALICAAMSIFGCGGSYVATVTGTVTLDGVVVPRGTVTFNPVEGGAPANGRIGENGRYEIRTGQARGLAPGQYRVTVIANEVPAEEQSSGPPRPGKPITPLWYRVKESSNLQYTVRRGKNEINLDLTSSPPPSWNPPRRR